MTELSVGCFFEGLEGDARTVAAALKALEQPAAMDFLSAYGRMDTGLRKKVLAFVASLGAGR